MYMHRSVHIWSALEWNRNITVNLQSIYDAIWWNRCSSKRNYCEDTLQTNKKKRPEGGNPTYIALTIALALIIALVTMPLAVFTILGSVDNYENASPNAYTWNATLNGTNTISGIHPVIIIVIVIIVSGWLMVNTACRGF